MAINWYDVDMNNSKNKAMYGKQRDKDLAEMYKLLMLAPLPEEPPEEPPEKPPKPPKPPKKKI